MNKLVTKSLSAALLSVCVGTVNAAPISEANVSELFGADMQHTQVLPLSQTTMQQTKGEFMQLLGFVLAAAAVDLAFTAVMWGSYIDVAAKDGAVGEDDVIIQDSKGAEEISNTTAAPASGLDEVKLYDDFLKSQQDAKSCDTFCVKTSGV